MGEEDLGAEWYILRRFIGLWLRMSCDEKRAM